MKERDPKAMVVMWGNAIYAIYLIPLLLIPGPFRTIAAVLVGAYSIQFIVRWVNRRTDPRYAKRPPDAP